MQVGDGFCDTPENQADAHTRGEQHREPGHGTELGPGVVRSEADLPEPAEHQDERGHEKERGGKDIEPAEVLADPITSVLGAVEQRLCVDDTEDDEEDDNGPGDAEDRWVGVFPDVGAQG